MYNSILIDMCFPFSSSQCHMW